MILLYNYENCSNTLVELLSNRDFDKQSQKNIQVTRHETSTLISKQALLLLSKLCNSAKF